MAGFHDPWVFQGMIFYGLISGLGMELCEEMTEAKHGDSCLKSQHLRGSGWKGCYEFKANLGYVAKHYREKRKECGGGGTGHMVQLAFLAWYS